MLPRATRSWRVLRCRRLHGGTRDCGSPKVTRHQGLSNTSTMKAADLMLPEYQSKYEKSFSILRSGVPTSPHQPTYTYSVVRRRRWPASAEMESQPTSRNTGVL